DGRTLCASSDGYRAGVVRRRRPRPVLGVTRGWIRRVWFGPRRLPAGGDDSPISSPAYDKEPDKANRTLLLKFTLIAALMFAFGYLLVPFYEQICKATGLRNLDAPDEIGNTQIDSTRTVRIELDANVNRLPWQFRPETPIVNVHPGQLMNLLYEVENTGDRPMTGQAIPSYGPPLAGS